MPVDVTCPHCARSYRVRSAMAGRKVECANCGETLRVPEKRDEASEALDIFAAAGTGQAAGQQSGEAAERVAGERGVRGAAGEVAAAAAEPVVFVEEAPGPPQKLDLLNPYTYVIAATGVMVLFLGFIWISSQWKSRPAPEPGAAEASAEPPKAIGWANRSVAPGSAEWAPGEDDFPALGEAAQPAAGIRLYSVSFPTGAPSREMMSLCLLLPERPLDPLPCVFVAPAGTPLITGSGIDARDQAPELYPYVRAGFAACTYSLDGPKPEHPTNAQVFEAYDKFRTAGAGLLNAQRAMDFVTARAPMIDRERFFVAGHSSAATLALLVAAREPRVKAVAAYCPCLDIMAFNPQLGPVLERFRPGGEAFLRENSPMTFASEIRRPPVLLFGSRQDQVVGVARYEEFRTVVTAAGGQVRLVIVPTGDHYGAMVQQGIPEGVRFFQSVVAGMGQRRAM